MKVVVHLFTRWCFAVLGAVASMTSHALPLDSCASALQASTFRPYLNTLSGMAVLVRRDGTITAANDRWRTFTTARGGIGAIGTTVHDFCRITPFPYEHACEGLLAWLADTSTHIARPTYAHTLPLADSEWGPWYDLKGSVFLAPLEDAYALIEFIAKPDRSLNGSLFEAILEEHRRIYGLLGMATWEYSVALGHFTRMDESAAALFGHSTETLLNTAAQRLEAVHPDDRVEVERAMLGQWNGSQLRHLTYRIVLPDGSLRWIDERLILHPSQDGRIFGVSTDVTTRTEEQVRLARLQQMEALALLAAGVSHDFNNLIMGIWNLYDQLSGQLPEELAQENQQLRLALRRAEALLQRLGQTARRQSLRMEAVNLPLQVDQQVSFIRQSAPLADFRSNVGGAIPLVRANSSEIDSILQNLLSNAVRATHPDRPLQVQTHVSVENIPRSFGALAAGEYVVLRVIDNGVGIRPPDLERIFDPYFTTRQRGEGTGLGLSAVRGTVESYGGAIVVRSTVGVGTEFTVYLPRATDEELALSQTAVAPEPAPVVPDATQFAGLRLLLAEDDPTNRMFLTFAFEQAGALVESAEDGAEALAKFRAAEVPFTAVVTDLRMPTMGGAEFIKELRHTDKYDGTLVVISGGVHGDSLVQVDGEESFAAEDVDGYIPKPATPAVMQDALQRALAKGPRKP